MVRYGRGPYGRSRTLILRALNAPVPRDPLVASGGHPVAARGWLDAGEIRRGVNAARTLVARDLRIGAQGTCSTHLTVIGAAGCNQPVRSSLFRYPIVKSGHCVE